MLSLRFLHMRAFTKIHRRPTENDAIHLRLLHR
jgi:hypothetical protein